MRQRLLLVIGALAFAGAAVASGAQAQVEPEPQPEPTTTTRAPTTTSPPLTTSTAPEPTPTTARPTTTVKGAAPGPSTTSRGPVPPPPSGASQPLDPSLLGGVPLVDLNSTSTTGLFSTEAELPSPTTIVVDDNAITVSQSSDGPSGATLALASLAWLASLGGLLIYAEDQRSKQWRHLAR